MADLFSNLSRTERQKQGVQKWVDNKLCGTLNWATGVGKTRGGLMAIQRFLKKNPTKTVIIVVPSEPIQKQWVQELADWNLTSQCSVKTMNDTSKNEYTCTLLVIDEIHKIGAPTLLNIFKTIHYTIILGLTATFERLDGKDEIIRKKCPIVDTITIEEAIENGWLADYREYEVLIEPEDIDVYKDINKEFYEHFSFFGHNFTLAMDCVRDWKARAALARERVKDPGNQDTFKDINKQILVHAMGFNRTLQARKKYIYNHPRKIELTNLILEHRQDKKCITFSAYVDVAEQIKYGYVYSGKDSKKKGRMTIDEFINQDGGVLNTVMKLNEGFNCPDISVSVILGFNSSQTTKKQRIGRVIRQKEGKIAEVFTLVLKGTVEEEWFRKSTSTNYIPISEDNLLDVLLGRPFTPKKKKATKMIFRF